MTFALVLVGVGLWAAPAVAQSRVEALTVTGELVCNTATGVFGVNWSVGQSATYGLAQIDSIVLLPAGTTVNLDDIIQPVQAGPASGYQALPAGTTSASLTVNANRSGLALTGSGTVAVTGTCGIAKPSASFHKNCDGSVAVTVNNASDATADAVITVRGAGGGGVISTQIVTVAPGQHQVVTVPANAVLNVDVVSVGLTFQTSMPFNVPPDCSTPTSGPTVPGNPGGGTHPTGTPTVRPTTVVVTPGPPSTTAAPLPVVVSGDLPTTGMGAATTNALIATASVGVLAVAAGIIFLILARRRSTSPGSSVAAEPEL